MDIWGLLITGGVAAAGIKLIETVTTWVLSRRATKKDRAELDNIERRKNLQKDMDLIEKRLDGLTVGQRVILQDRIKYLGRVYIKAKSVDLDDREDLIDMHNVYHDTLNGNGNLDALMKEILGLPLSEE